MKESKVMKELVCLTAPEKQTIWQKIEDLPRQTLLFHLKGLKAQKIVFFFFFAKEHSESESEAKMINQKKEVEEKKKGTSSKAPRWQEKDTQITVQKVKCGGCLSFFFGFPFFVTMLESTWK